MLRSINPTRCAICRGKFIVGYRCFIWIFLLPLLYGCAPSLSDKEKEIITQEIPDKIYKETIESKLYELDDYIWEGFIDYSDRMKSQVEAQLKQQRAVKSFLGGGFDVTELLGTSVDELVTDEYNQFVHYANMNRDKLYNMVMGVGKVFLENPGLLKRFLNTEEDEISVGEFINIENVAYPLNREKYWQYRELSFDHLDRMDWGMGVMGDYSKPALSAEVVFAAVVNLIDNYNKPVAEYAIYDKEEDSWEVGYNSSNAYLVNFREKGGVVHYETTPVEYLPECIKSKENVLKKEK